MQEGVWYRSADFAAILDLKETRTKELLRILVDNGEIVDDGVMKGKRSSLS